MRALVLLVGVYLLALPCAAQTYSCRDSQGRVHFADNPQRLPEDCRELAKEHKPAPADNLNYVPATPPPPSSSIEYQQSVEKVQRELLQRAAYERQLRSRAQALQQRYRDTLLEKGRALAQLRRKNRSSDYQLRKKVEQANAELTAVRSEKREMLQEMAGARVAQEVRKEVRAVLAKISDE